ncbi:MAG TPA: GntG family PLP-dependent aldolase [Chitinophagaceae bacterium]|jgi:threonine aldolase|nr:GntG family PLP-dependent aldolase [Chitinophagaceae bacterium]
MIDYRSDTVTRPTPEMLGAMMEASVGDDVFGEDPSVNALQQKAAGLFGMEDALFCPSGTMTNQIAIKVHTRPGDEVICSDLAHVYVYEGGGIAFNSGAQVKLINGDRGRITAAQVSRAVNPDDVHKPVSSLVCLENTANRGGGSCYAIGEIAKIREVCAAHDLKLHLDGARLFNALVAKKETPLQYGKLFDSISICLSKGLGAPVGSLLVGSKEFIRQARRVRKVFGGGMRQAGFLAAAGSYALGHHVRRLAEDHAHARQIADVLAEQNFIGSMMPAETNILIFEVKGSLTPASFAQKLKAHDILVIPISPSEVRMVLHLDITSEMVDRTCEVIRRL